MSAVARKEPTKLRRVQTTMLRLKIRAHATTKIIDVDPSTHIGSFLVSFLRHLEYPLQDYTGSPLPYRLRLSGGPILPYNMSFASLQVAPGSTLVLDVNNADAITIPAIGSSRVDSASLKKQWTRRSVMLAGIYTAVSGVGLMSGIATGILQRTAAATNKTAITTTPPAMQATPTKAVIQLTFTQHQKPVRSISWSPNGLYLASGSDDANVLIWSTDGAVRQQLPHQAAVRAVTWAPDSQRIAAGSANEVAFWQALSGTIQTRANSPHTNLVTSLAWASHGNMQLVSGGLDTHAVVWTTANADYRVQTIFTMHTTAIEATSFDPTGQIVATSSQGGLVRVWRAVDGQEVHGYYQPAQESVRAISFSPVQPKLALGGDSGSVWLWDSGLVCKQQSQGNFGLQCQDPPQVLRAHTKPVRSIAWSPSGRLLATGGEDGRLAIWNTQQGQFPLFTIQVADAIRSIAWGMTDAFLAAAWGNTVNIWNLH